MKAITSTDLATLEATQQKLDSALGYPIDGVDVGGGVHCPPEQSRTLRAVDIVEHPTLKEWMLPVDGYDKASPIFDAESKADLQAAEDVDRKEWEPVDIKP